MGLFNPVWMSENSEKRIKYVESKSNQDILKKIASCAQHKDVRIAALCKVTDDSFLAQFTNSIGDEDLALCAVNAIKIKSVAVELALNAQSDCAVRACGIYLRKRGNQQIFKNIALNAKSRRLVAAAIQELEDEEALVEIMLKDDIYADDCNLSLAALKRIEALHPHRVVDAYAYALDEKVREEAEKYLSCKELF
ncbi:MAG: hypothetical protein LBU32_03860 [Clostridiales bacterium]|nr:hypothetical protein [Clostridiales bacterium]